MDLYKRSILLIMAIVVLSGGSSIAGAHGTHKHDVRQSPQAPFNLRVTHDRFAAHAEPYLAVNPRNPQNLLGATGAVAPGAASAPTSGPADCYSVTMCYTPRELQVAYGVWPLLKRGIDGRGETVVLPELAEPQFPLPVSDIRQDLAQFDTVFHLPPARVRVVSSLAPSASAWLANGEEVLDTEIVHAIAPGAAIVELLVKATSLTNAASGVATSVAALRLGTSLGGVISISAAGQTGGEHCDTPAEVASLHAALQVAVQHHVTVVAASGDIGVVGEPCQLFKGLTGGKAPPVKEVNLPASDPLVLAAGGTNLVASHQTGAYISESAWGLPFGQPGSQFQASGGGFGHVFSRPSYQNHVPGIGAYRAVPDVAADASPPAGMAVVTNVGGGKYTISGSGGTSASAPLWAGLVALADQYAGHHLGFVKPASTASATAPSTTRHSTTLPPETTRCASRPARSGATMPCPAGTRSRAGAARTRACSSRCSRAPSTLTMPRACEQKVLVS